MEDEPRRLTVDGVLPMLTSAPRSHRSAPRKGKLETRARPTSTIPARCLMSCGQKRRCPVWTALHTAKGKLMFSPSYPCTAPPISVQRSEAKCNSTKLFFVMKDRAKIREGLTRASCGFLHTAFVATSHLLCDAPIGPDVSPPVQLPL